MNTPIRNIFIVAKRAVPKTLFYRWFPSFLRLYMNAVDILDRNVNRVNVYTQLTFGVGM